MSKHLIFTYSRHFDEESGRLQGDGECLHSVFDDKQEAATQLQRLELGYQRNVVRLHLENLHVVSEDVQGLLDDINEFSREKSGQPLLSCADDCDWYGHDENCEFEVDQQVYGQFSDDDILDLADLLDFRGYRLQSFDSEPSFYALRNLVTNELVAEYTQDGELLVYSESMGSLSEKLTQQLSWENELTEAFQENTKGTLNEISDVPERLNELLQAPPEQIPFPPDSNEQFLGYSSVDGMKLYECSGGLCLEINELLKNPVLEVVRLSLADIQAYQQDSRAA